MNVRLYRYTYLSLYRAVLSEIFKGGIPGKDGGGEVLVIGSLLHEVFEKVKLYIIYVSHTI